MNLIEKTHALVGLNLKTTDTNETMNAIDLVTKFSTVIGIVAAAIAFVYLVFSGFLYLTAGGNPDSVKKGQQGIMNAVIGLVIIGLAWWLVNVIVGTLNKV